MCYDINVIYKVKKLLLKTFDLSSGYPELSTP